MNQIETLPYLFECTQPDNNYGQRDEYASDDPLEMDTELYIGRTLILSEAKNRILRQYHCSTMKYIALLDFTMNIFVHPIIFYCSNAARNFYSTESNYFLQY